MLELSTRILKRLLTNDTHPRVERCGILMVRRACRLSLLTWKFFGTHRTRTEWFPHFSYHPWTSVRATLLSAVRRRRGYRVNGLWVLLYWLLLMMVWIPVLERSIVCRCGLAWRRVSSHTTTSYPVSTTRSCATSLWGGCARTM